MSMSIYVAVCLSISVDTQAFSIRKKRRNKGKQPTVPARPARILCRFKSNNDAFVDCGSIAFGFGTSRPCL